MLQLEMAATIRQNFGKEAMRSLRQQGQTPAILYGPKTDPLALSLETKDFSKALLFLHGQNAVFALEVVGGDAKTKRHVLLKEVQTDPVRDTVIHADFYEISLEEQLTLPVPIKFSGKPKGVDMGGVLNIALHNVHVQGRPLDIPDEIEVDITDLELHGPPITCGDLALPINVVLMDDPSRVCASVIHPTREEVEEEMGEVEGEGEEAGAPTAEAEGGAAEQEDAGEGES
jgi:large subunit ribosomal protein L25